MKSLYMNLNLKKLIKPLIFFFFLALIVNATAQTLIPSATSYCEGDNVTFSITSSVGAQDYELFKDLVSTGVHVTGDGGTVAFTGTYTAGSYTTLPATSTVVITEDPLPAIGLTVGGTGTICYGTGTNITVAGSVSGINYQLRNDDGDVNVGSTVAGNGGSINLPTGNLTTSTTFNVLAIDATTLCSAELTETEVVTVRSQFTAGAINTTGETICYNGNPGVIGSATAASGGDGTITYKWQSSANGTFSDAVDIASSDAATYDPPALTATTTYRRLAHDGTCNTSFETSTGTWVVTVNPLPAIGLTVGGTGTICYGTGTNITVAGSVSGINYQLRNDDGDVNVGSAVAGNGGSINLPTGNLTTSTTFNVLATDATTSCSAELTETEVVTVRSQFTAGAINTTGETICYNGDPGVIGSATAASGGDGTITYKWQSSANGTFSDAVDIASSDAATYNPPALTATTTYRRLAHDGTCNTSFETSTGTWVVTVHSNFTAGAINTDGQTICYSTGDPGEIGSATAASGGDGTITYKWQSSANGTFSDAVDIASSDAATYDPPSGLTATVTYRRLAHDGTCNTSFEISTGTYVVTVRSQFTAGAINTTGETVCYNGNPGVIGSATAASGGDGTITYKWQSSANGTFSDAVDIASSNAATYDPPALTATTTYRRMAKDGTCNTTFETSTGTWVVTVRSQFTSGAINTTGETICYNGDPAVIGSTTAASGGDGTITYKWQSSLNGTFSDAVDILTDAATYDPPSGLTATTTYRRMAKDGTCNTSFETSTGTWVVTVTPASVGGSIAGSATVCSGTNSTTLTLSGHTGSITKWQSSINGIDWDDIANTTTTYIATDLTDTTEYRAVVTNGICPSINSSTAIVAVNPVPSAPTATTPQSHCSTGASVALLTATGTAIQWYAAASGGTSLATTVLLVDKSYYYASQTVNGCESSDRFEIQVRTLPTRPIISGNTSVCLNDVTIYTTPLVSGYSYNWNTSSTSVGEITNAGTDVYGNSFASVKWKSIPVGTAYVKVTAINVCGSTSSLNYNVSINPLPQSQTLDGTPQYYCHNTSGATLTLNGSQTGVTYFVKRVSDGVIVNPAGAAGTGSAITIPDIQVENNTNEDIDSTQYYVTAESNAAACVEDMVGTVWVYKRALVIPGTIGTAQEICYNTTPSALTSLSLPTGGIGTFNYQWQSSTDDATWSDISGAESTTYAPGALTVTTYYRRGTYNDCSELYYTPSIMITVNPQIITNISSTDVSCNSGTDGSADLTVTGGTPGYTYVWTNGGGTSEDLIGIAAGTYTVTVTDDASCTTTNTVTITEPAILSGTVAKTDVTCNGADDGTISVTSPLGGYGTYEYKIDTNGVAHTDWQSSGSFTDLAPNTYAVYIRDAAHTTCVISLGSQTITEPAILSATVGKTDVTCYNASNGEINITFPLGGYGNYEYRLDAGTWQSSGSFTNLAPATYSVQIRDADHIACTITLGDQTITQPTAIGANVTTVDVTCNGLDNGTITFSAPFGGSGYYEYSINGSDWQSDASFTGLEPTTYSVYIRDSLVTACSIPLGTETVNEPDLLEASIVGTDVTCYGLSTGAADLTAIGGNGGNTYLWSNAEITEDITDIAAGTYTVTVTDTKGCTATADVIINEPEELIIPGYTADSVINVSCFGGSNGAVYITPTGGNGGNTYNWMKVPDFGTTIATTEDLIGVNFGTYAVEVTDSKGCVATATAVVTEPASPLSASISGTNLNCNGDNSGAADLTVGGGTSPYTYEWSNDSTTEDLTGLAAGSYIVLVTDANGCTTTTSTTLTEPVVLSASIVGTNVSCNGGSNGAADLTVNGGTSAYDYSWKKSPDDVTVISTSEDLTGLTAGTYNVTVTDAHGCTTTASVTITQPNILSATVAKTNVTCNGLNDGTITISNPQGGYGTYEYSRDGSNWQSSGSFTGLAPSTYSNIYIRDAAYPSCTRNLTSQTITQPDVLAVSSAIVTDINCYGYDDGAIDIGVTGGTTPYTYLWSNDSTTQDLTNLAAGTYTVTVTDANGCTAERTEEVEDAASWQPVILTDAPDIATACQNSTIVYSATSGVLGSTFQWIVTGGTIIYGANTSEVTINWGNGPIGTMTVIETRSGGCVQTSVLYSVTILPTPTPVITGLTVVDENQSGVTYTITPVANNLYTWVVNGGTVTSGIGTNEVTVTWGTAGIGTVSVTQTNELGCSGITAINVTIQTSGYTVDGYVMYDNAYSTPLNGVTVNLIDESGDVFATTITAPNFQSAGELGYYSFDNVPEGTYTINATYNGTFGGNNATDALIVQLDVVSPALSGIRATVADVNASTSITALDALYIKLRTVGSIGTYPAGNWKFETPVVTVDGGDETVDFAGLCVGDVNASYIPTTGAKATESYLPTIADNTIKIQKGQTFNYNIKSEAISNLGAMTLVMKYNENLFEIENVNSVLNDFKYEVKNGEVSIAWSDMMGNSLKNDGALVSFKLKAKETLTEETEVFSVLSSTEFADIKANIINKVNLKLAKVITADEIGFTVNSYPNPFSNTTNITYTIPENSSVKITLSNVVGQSIATITEEVKAAGSYNIELNATDFNLKNGIYFYTIEVNGITTSYVRTNKLVLEK